MHQTIRGKHIYIFKEHHHVLGAWSQYRRQVDEASILITIDHHTDCRTAFLVHCNNQFPRQNDEGYKQQAICRQEMTKAINFTDNESVNNAIDYLRHDEHIDAAIKANIISKAFVINYQESNDTPSSYEDIYKNYANNPPLALLARACGEDYSKYKDKEGYEKPEKEGIYIVGAKCWVENENQLHDDHTDSCTKLHFDQAVESIYLSEKLKTINKMVPGIVNGTSICKDYILDIDLDYFHTLDAVNPKDTVVFYELIRGAKIITIATEPECVENLKYRGEDIDSTILLEHILSHIIQALDDKEVAS